MRAVVVVVVVVVVARAVVVVCGGAVVVVDVGAGVGVDVEEPCVPHAVPTRKTTTTPIAAHDRRQSGSRRRGSLPRHHANMAVAVIGR